MLMVFRIHVCTIASPLACILTGCLIPHFAPRPRDLDNPKVLLGADFLSKVTFFLTDVGGPYNPISGIQWISAVNGKQNAVAVFAGDRHAFYVDPVTHEVQSTIVLNAGCRNGDFVDIEGDGKSEFFCHGGGWSDVKLFDHEGELMWSKSGSYDPTAALWMEAGDLNEDGTVEFCAAFSDYLACFDPSGKEIWRAGEDRSYWAVQFIPRTMGQAPRVVAVGQRRGSGRHYLEFHNSDGS